MNYLTNLLKNWHWIHTWSKWVSGPTEYVSYPWTGEGYYASTRVKQSRTCLKCGKNQIKKVDIN